MTEFTAEGKLIITEVDGASTALESDTGATLHGTDGSMMSAQVAGGGAGGRQRQWRRREHRWARQRTDYLENSVTYLESIDDKVGEGGDGGILGGIVNQVIDSGGEAGGAAALSGAAAALTGAATAHTGAAAAHGGAAAALTAAAGALSSGGSVSVKKPAWTPLQVEDVPPIDVEGVDPLAIEEPGTYPLEEPSGEYPLGEPSGTYPVAEPTTTYPIESPTEPYPVEDVGPIGVDVSVSMDRGGDLPGSGGGGGILDDILRFVPGGRGVQGSQYTAKDQRRATEQARQWRERLLGQREPPFDVGLGSSSNTDSSSSVDVSATSRGGGTPQSIKYVDRSSSNVTVETDTETLVNAALDEIEREYDSRMSDIEAELADIQRELEGIR